MHSHYYAPTNTYGHGANTHLTSVKSWYSIMTGGVLLIYSDERIKENIREVDDNEALQKLRAINCVNYEYKDKLERGTNTTIGFIAQQVKEHIPLAVSIQKELIPDKMCILNNVQWDVSGEKFLMSCEELGDVSGVKYRFYVSEKKNREELRKDIIGNSDNTFTFDKKWNIVFCYGKEVDDFHTLDKQKLFALNFSASQQLDKNQQKLLEEQKKLKETVQRQNTYIFELSSKIESLMSRITHLEQQST